MSDPFRPSNGMEGMLFQASWCDKCKRDVPFQKDHRVPGCSIISDSMCYNIGDPEYPKEWIYGEDGRPICTAFEEVEQGE